MAGCDRGFHLNCVGLSSLPEEEWFCEVSFGLAILATVLVYWQSNRTVIVSVSREL